MSELFDLLDKVPSRADNDKTPCEYTTTELRAKSTHLIQLDPSGKTYGGYLAVLEDPDGLHVSFVVVRFSSGPVSYPPGGPLSDADKEEQFDHIFHGTGPSGSLRELRHTYWGESNNSGYIYFIRANLVAAAFRELARWFDCD